MAEHCYAHCHKEPFTLIVVMLIVVAPSLISFTLTSCISLSVFFSPSLSQSFSLPLSPSLSLSLSLSLSSSLSKSSSLPLPLTLSCTNYLYSTLFTWLFCASQTLLFFLPFFYFYLSTQSLVLDAKCGRGTLKLHRKFNSEKVEKCFSNFEIDTFVELLWQDVLSERSQVSN